MAVGACVVTPAQVWQFGLVGGTWSWALVETCGPVHALAIRETCQVSISVDTHVHVVAPHAQAGRAVSTRLVLTARDWAVSHWLFLGTSRAPLFTGVDASGLLLLTLFLSVPPAPVGQLVAALTGVQVLTHLPGPLLQAASQTAHHLDVLHLGTLGACVAAVAAPDTTQGGC